MKNERMAALGRLGMAKRTPAERSKFARIGGVTAHQLGAAHEWTPETAKAAGRAGGIASGARRRSKREDGHPDA